MNFAEIEPKWLKFWNEHPELYRATESESLKAMPAGRQVLKSESKKDKKYILVEFPYPSGSGLHVGHAFSFTAADIYARFKRMQGYNVMFPMGWDAFGLPTENYAIKMKRKPQEIARENIDMFREQAKRLALSFDWEREVSTIDPNYYKWTQWIFIQLFKKGLAYKKEMPINWCPSCKIGLANEEVVDGKCERCGAEVSRRNISQWVVKITNYADRLLEGLKNTDFIDKVKQAQINWIDRKEWIDITYPIEGTKETVTVATTRPDTNFGATFIVLAPEHDLVSKLTTGMLKTDQDLKEIKNYVVKAKRKSELERQREVTGRDKTGVFTGLYAINHLTNKKMPIWITDFVLATVGTGAVVGVPGHDIRDFEFAKQFGLEVKRVVVGKDGDKSEIIKKEQVQEEEGEMVNSGFLDGLGIHEATKKVMDYLEEKGWGKRSIRYHLRDWIFSRQHYWGEPIPMIFCEKCAENQTLPPAPSLDRAGEKEILPCQGEMAEGQRGLNCGWVPVPEDQLPIKLPEVEAYEPTEDGKSPLSKIESFVKCKCPVCGGEAKRETDTMPNWAGSDWYYLAYLLPNMRESESQKSKVESNKGNIFIENQEKLREWMPVDIYIGGDEHNTLHLLYSRFIYQFLWDLGVVPKEYPEPYIKRVSHGVILGPDNQRMSKSKGNIIVPEKVSEVYGVDVIRCYLMFMGPFDAVMAWNEKTLMGVKRFLDRFSKYINDQLRITHLGGQANYELDIVSASKAEDKVFINKMVAGVTKDLEEFGYNTAIAKMMEGINQLRINNYELRIEEIKTLIKLIAPFAPYLGEELWSMCGEKGSVHVSAWPVAEDKYLVEKTITIAVAINGKVRDQIEVESLKVLKSESKEEIIAEAKKLEKIQKWLEGKKIIREIYVPGKMVNFVVE
ncbi:MAG: leucine--tRNA ligase [Candidatus Shapirobacteria bacterium]|jgi:leucyl-tRNA synthetase